MKVSINRIFFRQIIYHITVHVNKGHTPKRNEGDDGGNRVNGRATVLYQTVNGIEHLVDTFAFLVFGVFWFWRR